MKVTGIYSRRGVISISFGLMIEKLSERGFIYRRALVRMDARIGSLMRVVEVGAQVGVVLLIEIEIGENVGFAAGCWWQCVGLIFCLERHL